LLIGQATASNLACSANADARIIPGAVSHVLHLLRCNIPLRSPSHRDPLGNQQWLNAAKCCPTLISATFSRIEVQTQSGTLRPVKMSTTTTTEVIELQPIPFTTTPTSPRPKHTPEQSHSFSERDNGNHLSVGIEDAAGIVPAEFPSISKLQLVMTISQLSVSNFFSSFASGIITVGLPVIAESISLQRSLYLWPSSVYSLTSGAALLIAGSVADIVGARGVEVYGVFLLGLFILACGFAQTGTQLVVFRAMQGIALAMHIPAQVSIVAGSIPAGRARNIGFSFLGLSQPLGFSFGMVSSGIMIEKIGWRFGFYLSGGIMLGTAVLSQFTLPRVKVEGEGLSKVDLLRKLWKDVDWVGGSIAGSGLALLSYVLA
jgi:hypothetical protein